jgi:hypothetical protein
MSDTKETMQGGRRVRSASKKVKKTGTKKTVKKSGARKTKRTTKK